MEKHKKKEHEKIIVENNKEEENTIKEIKLVQEEEYIEIIDSSIGAENKEGNKEKQNTIEDGELLHDKKDKELINSKIVAENNEFITEIPITENSLTDKIEIEGENPERDKQIIGEQDKVHKIAKGSPLDNRSAKLQFERTRLREIKKFHNAIVRRDIKQEGRFKSSGKVYMRQKRSVMAFYVPCSTVHIHCNTWKLLGVKNNYYKGNEIITFGNEAIKKE